MINSLGLKSDPALTFMDWFGGTCAGKPHSSWENRKKPPVSGEHVHQISPNTIQEPSNPSGISYDLRFTDSTTHHEQHTGRGQCGVLFRHQGGHQHANARSTDLRNFFSCGQEKMGKAYGETWKQWKNLVTMIQWISLRGKLQESLKPLYIYIIYIIILDGIWMGKTMISCRFSHQPIQ